QLEILGNKLGGEVVCCSSSEQAAYNNIGIKASYINNGISLAGFAAPERKVNREKFSVITTGRIESQKNTKLFNGIAAYFEELGQFEFIWAGDGKDRALLTTKNIKVTGWVSASEIKALVSQSDLYLS